MDLFDYMRTNTMKSEAPLASAYAAGDTGRDRGTAAYYRKGQAALIVRSGQISWDL